MTTVRHSESTPETTSAAQKEAGGNRYDWRVPQSSSDPHLAHLVRRVDELSSHGYRVCRPNEYVNVERAKAADQSDRHCKLCEKVARVNGVKI